MIWPLRKEAREKKRAIQRKYKTKQEVLEAHNLTTVGIGYTTWSDLVYLEEISTKIRKLLEADDAGTP